MGKKANIVSTLCLIHAACSLWHPVRLLWCELHFVDKDRTENKDGGHCWSLFTKMGFHSPVLEALQNESKMLVIASDTHRKVRRVQENHDQACFIPARKRMHATKQVRHTSGR